MNKKKHSSILDNLLNQVNIESFFPPDQGEIADWLTRETIKIQFNAVEQHVEFANQSIIKEKELVEKKAWDFIEMIGIDDPVEQNSFYYALISDGYSPLHNEKPLAINSYYKIQWYSEFLFVYSLFEHTLNLLCEKVQHRSELNLSFKDSKGNGIERARSYLIKVAEVKNTFIAQPNWQRAKLLSKLRNKIAHSNGEIEYTPDDSKSLSARLKKEPHIKLEQDFQNKKSAEIILGYEFVKQSVFDFKRIVIEVCNYPLYAKKN